MSTEIPPTRSASDAAAAARLQILATEHWSLLATRALTYNEALSRVTIFLSILSGALIALALVAQADHFGPIFTSIAIPMLLIVMFVGITTVSRLTALNRDDYRWVIGMNRLRHGYVDLHPDLDSTAGHRIGGCRGLRVLPASDGRLEPPVDQELAAKPPAEVSLTPYLAFTEVVANVGRKDPVAGTRCHQSRRDSFRWHRRRQPPGTTPGWRPLSRRLVGRHRRPAEPYHPRAITFLRRQIHGSHSCAGAAAPRVLSARSHFGARLRRACLSHKRSIPHRPRLRLGDQPVRVHRSALRRGGRPSKHPTR